MSIFHKDITSLNLYNIEEFKFGLSVVSCSLLQNIIGPRVTRINSDFVLEALPLLNTLTLPRLRLTGKVSWEDLPLLRSIPSFQPNSIAISIAVLASLDYIRPRLRVARTGLENLDFFFLPDVTEEGKGANIEILNNVNLTMINLGLLENGAANVTVSGNGGWKTGLEMGALRTVGTLNLDGISGMSSPSRCFSGAFQPHGWGRLDNPLTVAINPALDLPYLNTIEGSLLLGFSSLTNISLPLLTRIGGDLDLSQNSLLETVTLPALRTANDINTGFVQLDSNPLLDSVSLRSLETAGTLRILNNSLLSIVQLPMLKTLAGDFMVDANPLLLELTYFSQFQHAVGVLEFHGNFSS